MGGACSSRRHSRRSVHSSDPESERRKRLFRYHPSPNSPGSMFRPARHSVESEVPDGSIPWLYPVDDNYVIQEGTNLRSPKALRELCIDAVCRSLPDLDGELPYGMPQDLVDAIVKSLIHHSALNATTLRALKNCEIEELSLAGCRGVGDEWLKPFCTTSPLIGSCPPPLCRASFDRDEPDFMDCDIHMDWEQSPNELSQMSPQVVKKKLNKTDIQPPLLIPKNSSEANASDEESVSSSSSSSSGYASFISATSSPDDELRSSTSCEAESIAASYSTSADEFADIGACEISSFCLGASVASIASNLAVLDLRGSPRLTDQGLLQLSALHSLEVVKLDDCHSLTGPGLGAFSLSNKLHTLSLANCRRLTDVGVERIAHLPSIKALSLGGCRCITDRSLYAISSMVQLQKLDVSQCDLVTDNGIRGLYKLEHIEELSIGWCRLISDKGLGALCSQPGRSERLRVLHLARCSITNDGVKQLGNLACLTELDLNGCSKIGSSVLGSVLEKLPKLKSLDVSYCPDILRESWQGKINALETLELCYAGVRDQHIARLTQLPALLELNLDSCPCGDWAITYLAENHVVPNLTTLDLADTDLTDAGLAHLAKLQLKKLSLFYCNISNVGLRHLALMTSLEVLNLDSRDIGDEGLIYLQKLPRLRSLDVFSGRVTDIGCMWLSSIKTLENLELCGGGITDRGCIHLALLENLTTLNLSQNERITNRGAAVLSSLTKLECLNLSNTKVNAGSLEILGSLIHLKSLALYGCQGIDDSNSIDIFRNGLPNLKCLRLNNGAEENFVWDYTNETEVNNEMSEDSEQDDDESV